MSRDRARLLCTALVALVCGLLAPATAGAQKFGQNGVIFVHGIEGTGAQFQSQAMRLTSNGYPADWIDARRCRSARAGRGSTLSDTRSARS